jgi:hypothetical protein
VEIREKPVDLLLETPDTESRPESPSKDHEAEFSVRRPRAESRVARAEDPLLLLDGGRVVRETSCDLDERNPYSFPHDATRAAFLPTTATRVTAAVAMLQCLSVTTTTSHDEYLLPFFSCFRTLT